MVLPNGALGLLLSFRIEFNACRGQAVSVFVKIISDEEKKFFLIC